jgi:hypothetical protein
VAKQRAIREFREAITLAQDGLKVYADLEGVERDSLHRLLHMRATNHPLAELHFSDMPTTNLWMAPINLQSVVDAVKGQTACSTVQFTLERQACSSAAHGPCLRYGIVVAGAAANAGALCALTEEVIGRGRMVALQAVDTIARPKITSFVAQSAEEHAHLYNNLVNQSTQPWTACAAPPTHVALTSNEAALLAPLPMILGEWFGF